MSGPETVASGVQDLIARLREEGVDAGRREADDLIDEAQRRAAEIVESARAEAEGMVGKATEQIASERRAATEALRLAVRNAVLELRERIAVRFAEDVRRLVRHELEDPVLLRRMILAFVEGTAPEEPGEAPMEIRIADGILEADDAGDAAIRHCVAALAGELVRGGIDVRPSGDDKPGIRVRMVGEDLELDLTDEALSAQIVKHLLPRFREQLRGESPSD